MKVLDLFITNDESTYRLVEVNAGLWTIKRNDLTLHICDSLGMGRSKFDRLRNIFIEDKFLKGGE